MFFHITALYAPENVNGPLVKPVDIKPRVSFAQMLFRGLTSKARVCYRLLGHDTWLALCTHCLVAMYQNCTCENKLQAQVHYPVEKIMDIKCTEVMAGVTCHRVELPVR